MGKTSLYRSTLDSISSFLRLESAGGLTLIAAALLALVISNSPLAAAYGDLLSLPLEIRVGALQLSKALRLWIDDGLMALFFLLVGLEIKRELLQGTLSTRAQIVLPLGAAVGGMVVPAGLYFWINLGDATALRGWAIPMATDIAFALGVIALFGKRVPMSLKVLLTAIAIADDLGAILVIAVAYTDRISALMLLLAAAAVLVLVVLNVCRVRALSAYMVVGVMLWLFVLKSGIHATLAGVVVALTIPLRAGRAKRTRRWPGWSMRCIPGWRSACCRYLPSPMPASAWPDSASRRCSHRYRWASWSAWYWASSSVSLA